MSSRPVQGQSARDKDGHLAEALRSARPQAQFAEFHHARHLCDQRGDAVAGPLGGGIEQRIQRLAPEAPARDGNETGDADRRQRIAIAEAEHRGPEAEQHQARSGQVGGEMQCIRRQRLAAGLLGDLAQGTDAIDVDGDRHQQHREGKRGWFEMAAAFGESLDRLHHHDAGQHEQDHGFRQRRQALELSVAVVMLPVGGFVGRADGEIGDDRRPGVDQSMGGLGEQRKRARQEAGDKLADGDTCARQDRKQCRPFLAGVRFVLSGSCDHVRLHADLLTGPQRAHGSRGATMCLTSRLPRSSCRNVDSAGQRSNSLNAPCGAVERASGKCIALLKDRFGLRGYLPRATDPQLAGGTGEPADEPHSERKHGTDMATETLPRLHRWAALALAPLFAVILLSGGLLALEPVLGQGDAAPRAAVDIAALTALLERTPIAPRADVIEVAPDGETITLKFGRGVAEVRLELATGAVPPEAAPRGWFGVLHDLHEDLLLDTKPVVQAAAWAMLTLVVTGPLLAWPRLRNTLSGWHIGIGWLVLPLVLLPPATAALRTLGVGHAHLPGAAVTVAPLTAAEAIARAAATVDLSRLSSVRRLDDGGVRLRTGQGSDQREWLADGNSVQALSTGRNWLKDLHDEVLGAALFGLDRPGIGRGAARAAWNRKRRLDSAPAGCTTPSRRYWRRPAGCPRQPDWHRRALR